MTDISAKDIFDQCTKKEGGRFDPATCDSSDLTLLFENYRTHAVDLINSATRALKPEKPATWIHFDFVDNTRLDAMAFREANRYFIGVNMGSLLLIVDLFYRMLSHPDILPQVGNPASELAIPRQSSALHSDADFIEQIETQGKIQYITIMPKDPVRLQYVSLLSKMAFEFLVIHEYAHIFNAHLLLSEQVTGRSMTSEARWYRSKVKIPMLDQALEMDADCFAVTQGFAQLQGNHRRSQNLAPGWRSFYENLPGALYVWMFAVYSLFRLMGNGDYGTEKLSSLDHPPPRMRQIMFMATIHENIVQKETSLMPDFEVAMSSIVLDVENAIAHITASDMDFRGGLEASGLEGRAHTSAILKEWARIEPEINRLKATL